MSIDIQSRISAAVRWHRPQQGLYTDGSLQCGCGSKYRSNEDWSDHMADLVDQEIQLTTTIDPEES